MPGTAARLTEILSRDSGKAILPWFQEHPLQMEAAGRLLVAPELRQFAQLEKQVWLVGQGSHFEIWSDAGWQKQQEVFFAMGDQSLPPGLEDLAL